MAELAAGTIPLTHEALDAYRRGRGADYLRHLLVANGVLAPRGDELARLQGWVARRLSSIDDPARRRLLRSYATWRVLRRARQRGGPNPTARTPTRHAKTCLNAAITLLGFLDQRGHDLAGCTQDDIDVWLTQGPPSAPEASDFLDWATVRRLLHDNKPRARRPGRRLPHPPLDNTDLPPYVYDTYMTETLTGRLNFRLTADQERALRQAAALTGQSVTGFVLSSAVEHAHELLERANHIELSAAEFRRFAAELDKPAEVVPELVALFKRHSQIPSA